MQSASEQFENSKLEKNLIKFSFIKQKNAFRSNHSEVYKNLKQINQSIDSADINFSQIKVFSSLENILDSINKKFDYIVQKVDTLSTEVEELKKRPMNNDYQISKLLKRLDRIEPIVNRSQFLCDD